MNIIRQQGAPTRKTRGGVGSILVDTISGKQYKCVFAYNTSDGWIYDWRETGVIEKVKPVEVKVKEKVEKKIADEIPEAVEPKTESDPQEPIKPSNGTKRNNYTQYSKKSK